MKNQIFLLRLSKRTPIRFALSTLGISIVFSPSLSSAAEQTFSQKNRAAIMRLVPLEKVTVGPSDNFQGIASPDENILFFTQNKNMASTLQFSSLASIAERGHDKPLLETNFDTRDPAPSPDGTQVAFTSFQKNARGQICVLTLATKETTCLPTGKRGSSQPQWLNGSTIAYLEKSDDVEIQNLMKMDLATKKRETLFSENVLAFTIHPDKNAVVFVDSQGSGDKPQLKWKSIDGKEPVTILSFNLPGLSGFPRFDKQGGFLYFIQFFNDTNNDGVIDGNDNSVPFRIRWPAAKESTTIPEQLISAEYNCTYPAPTKSRLIVTCNFEDSLDIYRMPLAGTIPSAWSQAQLLSAHAAARTVSERILILNTLRSRFASRYNTPETIERLLVNHIVAGEFDASIYYASQLSESRPELKSLLETLNVYLDLSRHAQREKSSAPSPAFVAWLRATKAELVKTPPSELLHVLRALIEFSLKNRETMVSTFSAIDPQTFTSPLVLYLYGELGQKIATLDPKPLEMQKRLEGTLSTHPLFEEEGQSHHALSYLRLLEQEQQDDQLRQKNLRSLLTQTSPKTLLYTFLQAEISAIDLLHAKNEGEKKQPIAQLAKLLGEVKGRYFLKRAIYVRLFTLFSLRNNESAVNFVASRWLSETKKGDAEYVYAREQYLLSRLDKAYAYAAENKLSFAGDIFYGAIRVTDDAEAHLGFLDTRINQRRGAELDNEYAKLTSKGFVAENGELASAWRALNSPNGSDKETIKNSIKSLQTVLSVEGYNPAVAWFLLGFANHKALLASRHKLEFNREPADAAHHAYLVAADLSRNNKRLLASIYENLGHLHMITRSYGQSARFYTQRLHIPFANRDEQILALWRAARSLFASNNAPSALKRIEEALPLLQTSPLNRHRAAFLEHAGFYALDAGQWEKSIAFYREFKATQPKLSQQNAIKVEMAYAWTLGKSGKRDEARAAAQTLLELSEKYSKKIDTSDEVLIPFQPERYSALAYAILATNAESPADAARARENRLKILLGWKERVKEFSLSESDWKSFTLRECNRLAADYASAEQTDDALKAWSRAIDFLNTNYKLKSDMMNPALFATFQNTLFTLVSTPEKRNKMLESQLEISMPQLLESLESSSQTDTTSAVRWLRLSLLWNGYQATRGVISKETEALRRTKILESKFIRELRAGDPVLLASLPGRARIVEEP